MRIKGTDLFFLLLPDRIFTALSLAAPTGFALHGESLSLVCKIN
jgi:hypothetical protein